MRTITKPVEVISSHYKDGNIILSCIINDLNNMDLNQMRSTLTIANNGNVTSKLVILVRDGHPIPYKTKFTIKDGQMFLRAFIKTMHSIPPHPKRFSLVATWQQTDLYNVPTTRKPITYENINYGQLVQCETESGRLLSAKVHFFNKRGALVGNIYEFVEYERLSMHEKGIVYEQKYINRPFESIRQKVYCYFCDLTSMFIRLTQEI